MHVISRYNQGGTAAWLNVLIDEQRKKGHQVTLLAGYVQGEEHEDSGFAKNSGIRIENLGKKISLLTDLKAIFEVRKQIKIHKPELINTHTSKAGLIGRLAAFSILKNRPAIVHTYHGHILYGYYGALATKVFTLIEILLSYITDVFLVSGKKVEKELREAKVIRGATTFQVRPGISEIQISTIRSEEKLLTIGWLGRLTQIKRPDRVIELAKLFPAVQFLIGGEGELRDELEKSAPANLKFLGWVNASDFWSNCDIALLTSDNEAQPIALIEASMQGLPVIAENVGSVSDVIIDMQNGLLVSSDAHREKALQALIDDKNLRERLGRVARQMAQDNFGIRQFIEGHETAYQEALKINQGR